MNFVLDLYQSAFPPEERKPFSLIERKAAMGEMEILLIRERGKPIGFAILAYGEHLVLLDYFAISEKWRSQGYGSAALELIQELYGDRQLFLEIEKPEKTADQVLDMRQRRKEFYLRNGLLETGIDLEMFGVKMELLSTQPGLTFEECAVLYRSLVGSMYSKVIRQISPDE